MRKIIQDFSILAVIVCLAATTASGQYLCGDANVDQQVNVSDAVHVINYVFVGGDLPDPVQAWDANCDGSSNVSDAVVIINYVFVGGYEPCDPHMDGIPDCTLQCPETVTDIDGNVYSVVKIGERCWMVENLKVTHYRNGDPIPNVTDDNEWLYLTSGAYCNYDNEGAIADVYGRLYNWHAVNDPRGLAPEGWHVPTDAEWKELEMYLGISQIDADTIGWRGTDEGGKLKEAGTAHWISPNVGATNESGFTALPAGLRFWTFDELNGSGNFWTSTASFDKEHAYSRTVVSGNSKIFRSPTGYMILGLSIRCVKD